MCSLRHMEKSHLRFKEPERRIFHIPCSHSRIQLPETPASWRQPCCRCTSLHRTVWCGVKRATNGGASSGRHPGQPRKRHLCHPKGRRDVIRMVDCICICIIILKWIHKSQKHDHVTFHHKIKSLLDKEKEAYFCINFIFFFLLLTKSGKWYGKKDMKDIW